MIAAGREYKTVRDWLQGAEVNRLSIDELRELNRINRDGNVLVCQVSPKVLQAWLCQPYLRSHDVYS